MFYLEIFLIFCSSFYVTITFADFNRFFFRVQRVITITLLLALVFDFQTARSEVLWNRENRNTQLFQNRKQTFRFSAVRQLHWRNVCVRIVGKECSTPSVVVCYVNQNQTTILKQQPFLSSTLTHGRHTYHIHFVRSLLRTDKRKNNGQRTNITREDNNITTWVFFNKSLTHRLEIKNVSVYRRPFKTA